MLRRPTLPLETLFKFNKAVESCPERFEAELISLFSQPLFLEALFTASPGLYDTFQALKDGTIKGGHEKVLLTLYKYLVRMCSRATPFGMFAGIACGTISPRTDISFADPDGFVKHTRLDAALLAKISIEFQKTDPLRSRIRFFPNTSLYFLDDHYRYIERVATPEGERFLLTAIKTSTATEAILACCQEGCCIEKMAESLRDEMDPQEALDFIEAAIDAQLLRSEMELTVTGPRYQDLLLKKLDELGAGSQAVMLEKITRLTNQRATLSQLNEARNAVSDLIPSFGVSPVIQTDLLLDFESCQLSQSCIKTLSKEFEKIQYLLSAGGQNSDLDLFKKDFYQRYQDREVPLLVALDSEAGIGFGSLVPGSSDVLPLLDDLNLEAGSQNLIIDDLERFKDRLFERAITGRTMVIELDEADLAGFKQKKPPASGGFFWLGSLIADSAHMVDTGNFKFILKALGGASGLELMGRFSHVDQQLAEHLKAAVHADCGQDCIIAEIAHVPSARTANILQRTHLTEYEIVVLSGSCLPRHNQIIPSELVVSVPNGKEIVLRSSRLNKRIVPQMSTAHNFSGGIPLYRFLCEVSKQQSSYLKGWDWGLHSNRIFLPRIQYKHWIITRASWNLTKTNYPGIFKKKCNFDKEWERLRKTLELPRYLQVCQSDNELLVDCESLMARRLLKNLFSKQQPIKLLEFINTAGKGILAHQGNFFENELVIPFRINAPHSTYQIIGPPFGEISRNFPVGSPWLYIKIYAGTKSMDYLLTSLIKPFALRLMQEGVIEKWFFIRYQDPLPHIRLRFYNETQPFFWQTVLSGLSSLLQPKIEAGLISKLQTDTYQREIERYRGLDFEQTESIFQLDSLAVIDILELIGPENEQLRWQAALAGADKLITDLGFTGIRKLELIQTVHAQLLSEFPKNQMLPVELNKKYRAAEKSIQQTMTGTEDELGPIYTTIAWRSQKIAHIIGSKSAAISKDPSTVASFVHMFLNRLFSSRSREQELVIYHYLNKYYKTITKHKI